jgi:hypothetical protein
MARAAVEYAKMVRVVLPEMLDETFQMPGADDVVILPGMILECDVLEGVASQFLAERPEEAVNSRVCRLTRDLTTARVFLRRPKPFS